MYRGRELQGRLAYSFKSIFIFSMGVLGFVVTWLAPAISSTLVTMLIGFIVLCAVASIWLDIARGANVMLQTALMLVAGVAVLGVFFWIYQSFVLSPPRMLFNFPTRTPTP